MLSLAQPRVMGIINVTPDSFYDQSRKQTKQDVIEMANIMLDQGADMLDVGAYSSRPGAEDVSEEKEIERLIPAIEAIRGEHPEAVISVDTFRANVAVAAIDAGADIINDISGGMDDPEMISTVARLQVPYILMHKKGTPATMQQMTQYADVSLEVMEFFRKQIESCRSAGIKDLVLDPGFGFAKNLEQNYQLLRELSMFQLLDLPLLIGVSRKSMIQKVIGKPADQALNGTSALHMAALINGAAILRVHDVAEAVEVVKLFKAVWTT